MINKNRLAETFKQLVEIDSVSTEEKIIAGKIQKIVESLGAKTAFDDSLEKTGSNSGNLFVYFPGNVDVAPLLFSGHMDTVEPGKGVKPNLTDGIFTSDGTTILGADDKSAIAIYIEVLKTLAENDLPHGPIEIVLSTCEEIGLRGAKNLDYSLISATFGYVLDSTDTEGIVVRAPAANRIEITVYGKDAHAGAKPEEGINAIVLAGKAIAGLTLGRIDHETTCNIGMIEGGIATNIVPSLVNIKGEVRSHDEEKLKKCTDDIVRVFTDVIETYKKEETAAGDLPRVAIQIDNDFPRTHVPADHPVVTLAQKAAASLGQKMEIKMTGGGADANIFFGKGILTGVLGTGMRDVHTVRENIKVDDMARTAELLLEIIRIHSTERDK